MTEMTRRGGSTFRRRLTTTMTVLSLAVLVALSSVVYLGVRKALLTSLDDTLLAIARAEVASAVDEPGGTVHVHDEGPENLTLPVGSGYEKFAQIVDETGRVIAETGNLRTGPRLAVDAAREVRAAAGGVSFADLRRGADEYRAIYYPFSVPGDTSRRLIAVVAVPMQPLRRSLALLLGVLLFALAMGGGGAAWGASRLARRLTRPLEEIAAAAHSVGRRGLSGRIPAVSEDAELRAVTDVLNDMLARLQEAFVAQQRFVGDASHELRSPLSNLRGALEVALRRPRSAAEYRETLEISLREVERLARLVDDLLLLERADAGQVIRQSSRCDLSSVAADAVTAHAPRAAEKHLQLTIDTPEATVVRGDPDRLRRVVDNLLDNALRYAPAGSSLSVSVRRDDREARLAVRDEGPGLSPEAQAHVFDRFYRADESRARESGGLGLGLAIAKAIVDAHHGRLSVESRLGHGATFTMRLALSDGDLP